MNVLVTGGAGYVGSICAEQLIAAGHNVVVIDDLSAGHRAAVHSEAYFLEADFGDTMLISDLVREHSIDAVMHFAGETLVEKSMTDPRVYFRSNVWKSLDFLDTLGGTVAVAIDYAAASAGGADRRVAGAPSPKLGDLELGILRQIVEGHTNREIALQVHRSENTIKFHVRRILEKTGTVNRTELARKATREGWL